MRQSIEGDILAVMLFREFTVMVKPSNYEECRDAGASFLIDCSLFYYIQTIQMQPRNYAYDNRMQLKFIPL